MQNHLAKKDSFTVIQLSDTHLFAHEDDDLFGRKTNKVFLEVLDKIKSENLKADFFLLTGDVSQDDSAESYEKIKTAMQEFNLPVYWVPGNHDVLEVMSKVFEQSKLFHYPNYLELKHWDFIFLNTVIKGSGEGFLSELELEKIVYKLENTENKSIAIIMHHHPLPTSTPLIDKYILRNREKFWGIINDNPAVKLIICGHVHNQYQLKYNSINLEYCPATSLQWRKGTIAMDYENKSGFKVFHFEKGKYTTKTIWLTAGCHPTARPRDPG